MFRRQLVPRLIPNSMRMLGVFALAASWLLVLSSAAHAFDVIQITNNSSDDRYPDISGANVAWSGQDGSPDYDYEIYFWDGVSTTQLTDNST